MSLITWLGGSTPGRLSETSPGERALVRRMFRQKYAQHLRYWGAVERDTARLFFLKARYDAHVAFSSGNGADFD